RPDRPAAVRPAHVRPAHRRPPDAGPAAGRRGEPVRAGRPRRRGRPVSGEGPGRAVPDSRRVGAGAGRVRVRRRLVRGPRRPVVGRPAGRRPGRRRADAHVRSRRGQGMTTPGFKDHFSGHATDYRAFRPVYPPELFAFLASAAPGRTLAWDCGTGNGQAAVGLAEHFERVFATDASAGQLAEAEPHPRVEYAVAPAERCPLPDGSVDLVTATQALHWFDHDRFYADVRRVCRPGGLLAATCYYEPSVSPEVDPVLRRWEDFIRPYWTPERVWVDAGYRTIPFPFPEPLPVPPMEVTAACDLARFLGY